MSLLSLLLQGAGSALALAPSKAISQYVHDSWQAREGLVQSSVEVVYQSRDGYLWLGTNEGLLRFDGMRFATYSSDLVYALLEGRAGGLWVGTADGLLHWRQGRLTRFGVAEGLEPRAVHCLYEDAEGRLWLGTDAGLSRLEGDRLTLEPDLAGDSVRRIVDDGAGGFWLATLRGVVHRPARGPLERLTVEQGLANDAVRALWLDRRGWLWAGTVSGLTRFDLTAGRPWRSVSYTMKDGLAGDAVRTLFEDSGGSLWVGTNGGLSRFRGEDFESDDVSDLGTDVVVALHEDREGSLWIGSHGGGLRRLRDGAVTTYSTQEGLPVKGVWTVFEDSRRRLWVGTNGGGLAWLRPEGGFGRLTTADGLANDAVYTLVEDRHGALWIGTAGGLSRFEDGAFRTLRRADGLANDTVLALLESRRGGLWIGSYGGLNYLEDGHLEDGRLTTYTVVDGLGASIVRVLLEDAAGGLWVGTNGGGISYVKDGLVTTWTRRAGLANDQVLCLALDEDGALWIGTDGGGLSRFADGRFTTYGRSHGLPGNTFNQLLEDGDGFLWSSGNSGLFRWRRQDLQDLAAGRRQRLASLTFGRTDGLNSAYANGGVQAPAVRRRDGTLWFATADGVAAVDPRRLRLASAPPPVTIEAVVVDGRRHEVAGGVLELEPGAKQLEVHYTALSLSAPERVRFRYRLEGEQEEWVEAGNRRVAYYTNLPPGTHTFKVRADQDGVGAGDGAGSEVASLTLRLAPRFHQTWLFYALCLLAAALMPLGVYQLRLRHMRRYEQQLRRRVQEALDQIKVLEGLLTICSSCKKIRDPEGDWNRLEVFIRQNSEADFSHGLCPDCRGELEAEIEAIQPLKPSS